MSRNIQFPPLNKRFTSGVKPQDIIIIDGRDKPDDKYDRFREAIGANNHVPKLVSKKRGLYNPTDIKRPAGIPGELKPRAAFLFKDDNKQKMDEFGNLVSVKGLTGLAKLFGDIEILDPTDSSWIDERARIVSAQTALGKTPKQIEDYLTVNKPLGREQNKVKRNNAILTQPASKGEQLAIINKAISDGLASTLAGQTAMTAEIIALLGKFGSMIDVSEQQRLMDAMNTIRPNMSWKEAPFNGIRFVKPEEFNQANPKLGFILALILQTAAKYPGGDFINISKELDTYGMKRIDSLQNLFVMIARLNPTNPGRMTYADGRPIDGLFDLQTNMIATVPEAEADVGDPILFLRLTGFTTTDKLIEDIDRKEAGDLDNIERQLQDWVNRNKAKLDNDINDLRSARGQGLANIDAEIDRVKQLYADKRDERAAVKISDAYIKANTKNRKRMLFPLDIELKRLDALIIELIKDKDKLRIEADRLSNMYVYELDREKEAAERAQALLKQKNRAERDRLVRFVRSYMP
jgi:hypothetical protein